MRYGTICSGVDAVSLAWEPLGFKPQFFSEIEPFPKAVLAHHWPHVPDLGDLTKIDGKDWADKLDILWGSTPCQAFSLAGRRAGATDPRGALALSFCNLADDIDPPFVCFENVKGILNDQKNAFGCLLAALAGEDNPLVPTGGKWSNAGCVLGPRRRIAWRLFDAKYAGVPQRRERVFVVACPREGADPRELLFEERSGAETFPTPDRSRKAYTAALETRSGSRAFSVAFRGRKDGEELEVGDEVANCLLAATGGSDKAFALIDDGVSPYVRQLTPIECERLMGMPDNHTLVPFGRAMASDTVRYKAIGNSLVVPDVRWIGKRILTFAGSPIQGAVGDSSSQ
jgi:site-specific DNA-cytosine methylase